MKKIVLVFLLFNTFISGFTAEPLSDNLKKELVECNVWKEVCPFPMDRLRILTMSYVGFGGGFKGTVYSGKISLLPPAGVHYLNRSHMRRGMDEQVVGIFKNTDLRAGEAIGEMVIKVAE